MFDIEALARNQLDDYRNINPGTCFSEPTFEISVTEAYQIQDAVTDRKSTRLNSSHGYNSYAVLCLKKTKQTKTKKT